MSAPFQFPALVIAEDLVVVYPNEEHLYVSSKHAIKNHFHETIELVDGQGNAYRVMSFQQVSEPFWKRPKTPFGKGVRLRDFVFKRLGARSLKDVKTQVESSISKDDSSWAAAGDVSELLREVQAAGDFATLIDVLGFNGRGH